MLQKQNKKNITINKLKISKKVNVAIFASGAGSNLINLFLACQKPKFPAKVVVIFSNNPNCGAINFAKQNNIPYFAFSHKNFATRQQFEQEISKNLVDFGVELICLAGFMRVLSAWFVNNWQDKIINIHPSLLPSFKGANAVRDALKFGVKIAGCTTHFVNEAVDEGKIIKQAAVLVSSNDNEESLKAKILRQEHKIYPATLKIVANLMINNNKT